MKLRSEIRIFKAQFGPYRNHQPINDTKVNRRKKLLHVLSFTTAFILFTPIGTISHEFGHVAVARLLGYETTLNYGSMNTHNSREDDELISIYSEFKYEIENNKPFSKQEEYFRLVESLTGDDLLIVIGGPLQTVLTGLFGFMILLKRRIRIKNAGPKLIDWLAIFLALFWLREVFNLSMSLGEGLIYGTGEYFRGDEAEISRMLELPVATIPIALGGFGILISTYVVFRIVPEDNRIAFIAAGLLGGVSGFILWMHVIGPILLP